VASRKCTDESAENIPIVLKIKTLSDLNEQQYTKMRKDAEYLIEFDSSFEFS
jgi:hypothetical protein